MNKVKHSYIELMHLVDLTCLRDNVEQQDIVSLTMEAEKYQTAAVCVWPEHLDWITSHCKIQKATVVNFPKGTGDITTVLKEIDRILLKHPGTEIDYVFPYEMYWSGYTKEALSHCQLIQNHCQAHGVILKVILETGAQADAFAIQELALKVIDLNVGMLKTSTGKIAIGATPAAVEAICLAIRKANSKCGIKISGGIKTYTQALNYLDIIQKILPNSPSRDWLRFGASQLSNDIEFN